MPGYRKKPVHVEFVGVAAAGKSSISQACVSRLRAKGYDVVTPEKRFFEFLRLNRFQRSVYPLWNILKDARALRALMVLFMYVFQLRPFSRPERREYYLIAKSLILKNFFAKTGGTGIFVFGGEITALPGLHIGRLSDKHLAILLDSLLIHDVIEVVVFVDTPIEVAIKRAQEEPILADFRPEAFVEDTHKRRKMYQRRIANQRRLIEALGKRGEDFRVVEVDGTKLVEENAEHIIGVLEEAFLHTT